MDLPSLGRAQHLPTAGTEFLTPRTLLTRAIALGSGHLHGTRMIQITQEDGSMRRHSSPPPRWP